MKKKVAVIGVGTAGVTTLSHCLAWLDADWEVYSISDPNTPILGIGESTTVHIPTNLFLGTGFNILNDGHELDATTKLGVKWTGWREKDFNSLIVPPNSAIHLNNFKIKDFCFKRFKERWGDKFKTIYGKVHDVFQSESEASVIIDKDFHSFDYIIDCSGYPENYDDYVMSQVVPVNHCLVHMIPEPGTWNYTYHTAHRNGWMFGIPLQTRQGWGYLYNDEITPREDAEADICERFNVKKEDLNLREFKFKSYYAKKFIDGRIIKNGNRALFFEPIEALSGFFYDRVCYAFTDMIKNGVKADDLNHQLEVYASSIETFVAYAYHGGSNYDSDFWKYASERGKKHLEYNQRFLTYLITMAQKTPEEKTMNPVFIPFAITNWEDFDKGFGYDILPKRSNNFTE